MNINSIAATESVVRTLRRFAQPSSTTEECEFCSVSLASLHRHLFECATRRIVCVCEPCALRFENVVGRWRLIPRDPRALQGFQMGEGEWERLGLPIQLAFFFYSTTAQRVVAMYPSPAGATESLLPLTTWDSLVAANPSLGQLQPDVEALLVNRLEAVPECFVAPIDLCFELVGRIRLHWRGLSGGDKVGQEIAQFFSRLRSRTETSLRNLEAPHAESQL